ncbi:MAG: helix-turn-helix transcriptional regulator [Rhodoferax sp.]|uniref:helix-turn-helix domain-containing protein n=1 Tax=Rhodoferax sp. TaxID=50421 RepID=UPI0017D51C2F|nr:helix-turn-helix transcriptional regulator [Rhodoferax sp.]NMM21659.1 helix-turn-helix transcriptional regulator [Rhodoferax sp.]
MIDKLTNVTTDNAIIGVVIIQLREMYKPPMRQQDLAEKMGLTPSAWSRVEKGDTELSAPQVRMLSRIFESTTDRIFEMAEQIREELQGKGVVIQPQSVVKQLGKANTTNVLSGATMAGLAASGIIPIFGPVLFGIVGGIMAHRRHSQQNKENKE